MFRLKIIFVALLCFSMLTGFGNIFGKDSDKEKKGTAGGAVIGGILGNVLGKNSKNRKWLTVLGVAAGAFIGNQIGKNLDEKDKEELANATIEAAETGEDQKWENKESGKSGEVKVTQAALPKESTQYSECREIEQSVVLNDGSEATETVKACKGDEGAWAII